MNNDDVWLTIGEAAERTGLPVKTVRYYADIGLVPSTGRSSTGYRLYDSRTLARLDLVRTLRELGFDLASIRAFLDQAVTLSELATSHAAAIDAQIRILRTRRSVLRAVARLGIDDQKELETMNKLAQLSAEERQRIIDEYWDETFSGLDLDPQFVQKSRSVKVDLPDDPTQEQVDAWIELAELVQDPDYRARVREMAKASHDARGSEDEAAAPGPEQVALFEQVTETVTPLREAGVEPDSEGAQQAIGELAAAFAAARGVPDDAGFRRQLADQITTFSDRRVERFWELVGIVNGWRQEQSRGGSVAAMEWFAAALRG
ncbi:MerR family transcriptional regulator [Phytoactinopolyspora halotolerans]|uniref:MerR family transcriptional regulator n=1 Tax=Phytoactinopolyspora halotolerans TaxID=1981512 RepID=UPI001C20BB83|nr:MerR family transcriptional regulator [Phytoactinopolyspora halotolerans]